LAKAQGKESFAELAKSMGYETEAYEQYLLDSWKSLLTKFNALTSDGLDAILGEGWSETGVVKDATYGQQEAYAELMK
jgi:hypothetical protein